MDHPPDCGSGRIKDKTVSERFQIVLGRHHAPRAQEGQKEGVWHHCLQGSNVPVITKRGTKSHPITSFQPPYYRFRTDTAGQ